jgi:hypothetical protein
MAVRVNLDTIPATAQPAPVAAAISEAGVLRDKLRTAKEAVARVERALTDARQRDIEAAAARMRGGEAIGGQGTQVTKAEQQLAKDQRSAAIIERAYDGATNDLAATIAAASPGWIDALADEQERARAKAVQALDEYEHALGELRSAAATSMWLESALQDQRLDRPLRSPLIGSRAWSSARVALNSEPFMADVVVGWARELLAEPPTPSQVLQVSDAASAA